MTRDTDAYFARFAFCPRQIAAAASDGLSLAVVIPCFNDPNLIGALDSLRQSEHPNTPVEVIVVINSAADAPVGVLEQNQRTLAETKAWISTQADSKLSVHLILAPELPPRHAGVGLARKIGMDEALRRFDDVACSIVASSPALMPIALARQIIFAHSPSTSMPIPSHPPAASILSTR